VLLVAELSNPFGVQAVGRFVFPGWRCAYPGLWNTTPSG
jgi:hypothetical protein